eukprot:15472325-Alexandrium_andersonii.AAC.1
MGAKLVWQGHGGPETPLPDVEQLDLDIPVQPSVAAKPLTAAALSLLAEAVSVRQGYIQPDTSALSDELVLTLPPTKATPRR